MIIILFSYHNYPSLSDQIIFQDFSNNVGKGYESSLTIKKKLNKQT